MKYQIPYAKIAIIISFVFAFASCKKVDTQSSSATQSTTTTGKGQSAFYTSMLKKFNEQIQAGSLHGRFGMAMAQGVVDRTDNVLNTNDGNGDPNPIDCVMEAFVYNHSITIDQSCNTQEVNLIIENHYGGSDQLDVTLNGFPYTATLMGEDPNNHCRSVYQLLHVNLSWLGINPFTGGNLHLDFSDPSYNGGASLNTQDIWIQYSACDGTYQPAVYQGSNTGELNYFVPITVCNSVPLPDHYRFTFKDQTNGGTVALILTIAHPTYLTSHAQGGFISGHVYEIWGEDLCSGVSAGPWPGQPFTATAP